ncbi:PH domain-containing protein [Litorivivens sp.]|uniref:PH domain-containing protein n=1 Tax=Litorivivens sp. TaxID=2020868 RepID=UPI0035662444
MSLNYSEHPVMFRARPFAFIGSLILVPVGIGIIIFLVWYMKCKATKLQISGGEICLEQGLLSKDRTEVDVRTVRTVKVYQSFMNRMLGVGDVSVFTAGDEAEIYARGMPRPQEFRDIIKGEQ